MQQTHSSLITTPSSSLTNPTHSPLHTPSSSLPLHVSIIDQYLSIDLSISLMLRSFRQLTPDGMTMIRNSSSDNFSNILPSHSFHLVVLSFFLDLFLSYVLPLYRASQQVVSLLQLSPSVLLSYNLTRWFLSLLSKSSNFISS